MDSAFDYKWVVVVVVALAELTIVVALLVFVTTL